MPTQPSVFISYSHDNSKHKAWVLSLARRLQRAGVRVWLDQFVDPGVSLTQFMANKIKSSKRVLLILTPNYARKTNSRLGGVGFEQQIISGVMARRIPARKFVPILRKGDFTPGRRCAIPTHLDGIAALDMRARKISAENFERLRALIFGRARVLEVARPHPNQRGLLRLPTIKADGWRIDSGERLHRKYPRTFHIPNQKDRSNLEIGDVAKLPFHIREADGNIFGERMWVRITGRLDNYYVGTLSNVPVSYQRKLKWGSAVVFLPKHVIDFERASRRKKGRVN